MLKQLEAGKITEKQYQHWRTTEMVVGKAWEDKRDQLTDVYLNADKVAAEMMEDNAYKVYADNFNFSTFKAERAAMADTAFTLYDKDAVKRLVKDDPNILPAVGKRTAEAIRLGKAKRWNNRHVQSVMTQSILQGESIPQIAERLSKTVGEMNMHSAVRAARTMTTGAENAGRVDGYKRAEKMGINVKPRWMAALDSRTRHSHRVLDGEVIGKDGRFSNGCRYPGDPEGRPEEIYNCRCRTVGWYEGINDDLFDIENRWTGKGFTSYDDWLKAHKKKGGDKK